MKKIGWSILIGLLTIVSLNAQETVNESVFPKNIIKVHPLGLLDGSIGLGYERVIMPKTSIEFELFQQFNDVKFDNDMSERNYNLFFETGLRRYLSKRKKAPEGFFLGVGAFALYNNFNTLKNEDTDEITNDAEALWVGANVKTGYQWIFKKYLKGITAETNISLDNRTRLGIFDRDPENEWGVNLRFSIGYSW